MAFQLISPLGGKRKMALLGSVFMTLCTYWYCQQVAFEDLFASWICDIRGSGIWRRVLPKLCVGFDL